MTLVVDRYRDEIFGGFAERGFDVRAVTLDVSASELRRRIVERVLHPDDEQLDDDARRWCLDQVERCVGALGDVRYGHPVSNEGRPIIETVDEIERIVGH